MKKKVLTRIFAKKKFRLGRVTLNTGIFFFGLRIVGTIDKFGI